MKNSLKQLFTKKADLSNFKSFAKVLVVSLLSVVVLWSCASSSDAGSGSSGRAGAISLNIVDGDAVDLNLVKGTDREYTAAADIIVGAGGIDLSFGAANLATGETVSYSVKANGDLPSGVGLDADGITFGLADSEAAGILSIPLLSRADLTVEIIVEPAPAASSLTLASLTGPTIYSVRFDVIAQPRLSAFTVRYTDTDTGFTNTALIQDFDPEIFNYTVSIPSSGEGTLAGSGGVADTANYSASTPAGVPVTADVTTAAFTVSADLLNTTDLGSIPQDYTVTVNLLNPVTVTRGDNGNVLDLTRTGAGTYTASAVRTGTDLMLTFNAATDYGIEGLTASYAGSEITSEGVLTLSASDVATIVAPVTITLENADVSATFTVTVTSESAAVLDSLLITYDDGQVTLDATDPNIITANYGNPAVTLVGDDNNPYQLDVTSYEATASASMLSVLPSGGLAGFFEIDAAVLNAAEGDIVTVGYSVDGATATTDVSEVTEGAGIYRVYYGAAGTGTGIPQTASSVTFTVEVVQAGKTSTTYTTDVGFNPLPLPSGDIQISYIDPSRADQDEPISVSASQTPAEVTFTTSAGRGSIVVSPDVPNSESAPIGYYLELPNPTDFANLPDGFAGTDGTITLNPADLTFTEGSTTATLYVVVGDPTAVSGQIPDSTTGLYLTPAGDDVNFVASANVLVYTIAITLQEETPPSFTAFEFAYDDAGSVRFVEIDSIPVASVFTGGATSYGETDLGDTVFQNKNGGTFTLNGVLGANYELYNATLNGADLTREQVLGTSDISIDPGVSRISVVLGLQEIGAVANKQEYTIDIPLTLITPITSDAVTSISGGDGTATGTDFSYNNDTGFALSIGASSATPAGVLTVDITTSAGAFYLLDTNPEGLVADDLVASFTAFLDQATNEGANLLGANGSVTDIAIAQEVGAVVDLFLVVATDVIDATTADTVDVSVFPLRVGFFDNFAPQLSGLTASYYGLDLGLTPEFASGTFDYTASHTNFGGLAIGEGYTVTIPAADAFVGTDGTTLVPAAGVTTNVAVVTNDSTATITITVGDGNPDDPNIYIDNFYTLTVDLTPRTTSGDLVNLVTGVTVNSAASDVAAQADFTAGDANNDEMQNFTYTNTGLSFDGSVVLAVNTSDLGTVATIDPLLDEATSTSTATIADIVAASDNGGATSVTLTEVLPSPGIPAPTPTLRTVTYTVTNVLTRKGAPDLGNDSFVATRLQDTGARLVEVEVAPTGDPAGSNFNFEVIGLTNQNDSVDSLLTFTLPAGYEFVEDTTDAYSITANPLIATARVNDPDGVGEIQLLDQSGPTFMVTQVGDPDGIVYAYTTEIDFSPEPETVTLDGLMVSYYGLDLLSVLQDDVFGYTATHTNYLGLTLTDGYSVTAGSVSDPVGNAVASGAVLVTSNVALEDATGDYIITVELRDNAVDANDYVPRDYTLRVDVTPRTTLDDIVDLVTGVSFTRDETDSDADDTTVALVSGDTGNLADDNDLTDDTRTLTYVNSGVSFAGTTTLDVASTLAGVATISRDSASLTVAEAGDTTSASITLTEVLASPGSPAGTTARVVVYTLENALAARSAPTVADGDLVPMGTGVGANTGVSFATTSVVGVEETFTVANLTNTASGDTTLTFTLPADYEFVASGTDYVINPTNVAKITVSDPAGTQQGANVEVPSFVVIQTGASSSPYTYAVGDITFRPVPAAPGLSGGDTGSLTAERGTETGTVAFVTTTVDGTVTGGTFTVTGLTNGNDGAGTTLNALTLPEGYEFVADSTYNIPDADKKTATATVNDPDRQSGTTVAGPSFVVAQIGATDDTVTYTYAVGIEFLPEPQTPQLAGLTASYYGLALIPITGNGVFAPATTAYTASHTNFGGFNLVANGGGYTVTTPGNALESDGSTTASGVTIGSTVTSNLGATPPTATITVDLSDAGTDDNSYIATSYAITVDLDDRTTAVDIENLVTSTVVSNDTTQVSSPTFRGDNGNNNEMRTFTFTNTGVNMGDVTLKVGANLSGKATILPALSSGISTSTIGISDTTVADIRSTSVVLTEVLPTSGRPANPTKRTVTYTVTNNLTAAFKLAADNFDVTLAGSGNTANGQDAITVMVTGDDTMGYTATITGVTNRNDESITVGFTNLGTDYSANALTVPTPGTINTPEATNANSSNLNVGTIALTLPGGGSTTVEVTADYKAQASLTGIPGVTRANYGTIQRENANPSWHFMYNAGDDLKISALFNFPNDRIPRLDIVGDPVIKVGSTTVTTGVTSNVSATATGLDIIVTAPSSSLTGGASGTISVSIEYTVQERAYSGNQTSVIILPADGVKICPTLTAGSC